MISVIKNCFPDKRLIGSCMSQEPIDFTRGGKRRPCLARIISLRAYSLPRGKQAISTYTTNLLPIVGKIKGEKNTVYFLTFLRRVRHSVKEQPKSLNRLVLFLSLKKKDTKI